MPRYDYVVERFKSYGAWIEAEATENSTTFRPKWTTSRPVYRWAWVLALLLLFGVMYMTYQAFPVQRTDFIELEDFGALVRQHQAGEIVLTATACDVGIIGEVDGERIIWVDLGYSGARWTASYALPDSVWADECHPIIFLQSQRLIIMLVSTVLLALLYFGVNYFVAYRKWQPQQPVTIQEHGDTVLITSNDEVVNPSTYDQLDETYNLPTSNIRLRRVAIAAIVFTVIGMLLSLLSAYFI